MILEKNHNNALIEGSGLHLTVAKVNGRPDPFSEVVLFASHYQEFVSTVANRIIEITQGVAIDRTMDFEDDLEKRDYLAETG